MTDVAVALFGQGGGASVQFGKIGADRVSIWLRQRLQEICLAKTYVARALFGQGVGSRDTVWLSKRW